MILLVTMTTAAGNTSTLHVLNLLKDTIPHMMPQVFYCCYSITVTMVSGDKEDM